VITKPYQNGKFNGMEDIYEYESIDSSLGCEGAKYVMCHREASAGLIAKLAAKAKEHFGTELDPSDYTYHSRLADIEKMFFPYTEVTPKRNESVIEGSAAMSGLEYKVINDVDTRDNSEIFVVKIITKVDDFKAMRQVMDSFGGYYSRFKKGFIFKDDPTAKLRGDSAAEAA